MAFYPYLNVKFELLQKMYVKTNSTSSHFNIFLQSFYVYVINIL